MISSCSSLPRCNHSYEITTPAVNRPLTIAEVKEHLKITGTVETETFFNALIDTATLEVEKYIRRDLINRTYKTYRDIFPICCEGIVLKRSKFQSLTSFKYLIDGVLTDVDSNIYYTTSEIDYSGIYLVEDAVFPGDIDKRLQAIEIVFVAGYGASASSIPADLKQVLLMIIACLYANRGDCNETKSGMNCLGLKEQAILDKYKILNITSTC